MPEITNIPDAMISEHEAWHMPGGRCRQCGPEHLLVAEVNPVERADANDRGLPLRIQRLDSVVDKHREPILRRVFPRTAAVGHKCANCAEQ